MAPKNESDAAAPSRSGGSQPKGNRAERARDDLLRRVPPHSVEAEQAVLSGVFLRPDLLHEIVDQISDTDFYMPAHRLIFGAFLDLYGRGVPVDEVTVFDWLRVTSNGNRGRGRVPGRTVAGRGQRGNAAHLGQNCTR